MTTLSHKLSELEECFGAMTEAEEQFVEAMTQRELDGQTIWPQMEARINELYQQYVNVDEE